MTIEGRLQHLQGQARAYAKRYYSEAPEPLVRSFVNAIGYLVLGANMERTCRGLPLREYLVYWSLAGDGPIDSVAVGDSAVTQLVVAEGLHPPGEWEFGEACLFAAPRCFEPITDFGDIAWRILDREFVCDIPTCDREALGLRPH